VDPLFDCVNEVVDGAEKALADQAVGGGQRKGAGVVQIDVLAGWSWRELFQGDTGDAAGFFEAGKPEGVGGCQDFFFCVDFQVFAYCRPGISRGKFDQAACACGVLQVDIPGKKGAGLCFLNGRNTSCAEETNGKVDWMDKEFIDGVAFGEGAGKIAIVIGSPGEIAGFQQMMESGKASLQSYYTGLEDLCRVVLDRDEFFEFREGKGGRFFNKDGLTCLQELSGECGMQGGLGADEDPADGRVLQYDPNIGDARGADKARSHFFGVGSRFCTDIFER
jgi:hypothetical protein